MKKDVDGRDKPGHDEDGAERIARMSEIRGNPSRIPLRSMRATITVVGRSGRAPFGVVDSAASYRRDAP